MTAGSRIGAGAGVLIALTLASCGRAPLGTGVVLWNDVAPLVTGTTVQVMEESTIEDHYLVREPGADRQQEPVPIDRWRVRVFADGEEAAAFAARFAGFADSYGYATRRGLPVRASASATAGIIYKFREQEVAKVLERGAEPEQVGAFENYWYEVLTADGTVGYTFGEFLTRFESAGDPYADAARLFAADPTLDKVLATVWRPESYRVMQRRRRYDLDRFRAEYGLFPEPEAQRFRLVTERRVREFPYRTVARVGDDRYALETDRDGAVRFVVRSGGRLALSYVDEGRLVTEVYVDFPHDVDELIAAERERRDGLYADLLRRGSRLRSGGYGTIELTEKRGFRWRGFAALVPGLLPAGLPGTGVVDFRYALGAPLAGSYDGAVTLLFDGAPEAAGPDSVWPGTFDELARSLRDAEVDGSRRAGVAGEPPLPGREPVFEPAAELTLLLLYDGDGVRLTPAEPATEALAVTRANRSGLVMYFSFAAADGG